jgi:hypothetical protein
MTTAKKKAAPAAKPTKPTKPTKATKVTETAEITKPVAKTGWSDTIKKALEKKRQPGGWPEQPKPRDSGIKKVKKDAF